MFLFIAYKPDSEDYCRGCRMASYSADHTIINNLATEKLIEIWADYLLKNLNLDINEAGYDFWIFKDGIKVWNENYSTWDGGDRYDNTEEYYQLIDELEAQGKAAEIEISVIHQKAKQLAESKNVSKEEAKKRQAQVEKEQKEQKEKEDRFRKFQELSKEFREKE